MRKWIACNSRAGARGLFMSVLAATAAGSAFSEAPPPLDPPPAAPVPATAPPSALGPEKAQQARDLYKKFRCATCHAIANEGGKVGPALDKIGLKERAYLKESLVDPKKIVSPGYQPSMPSLQGRLSDEELNLLVDWLMTLK